NVAPLAGDSHANLGWNHAYGALMTRDMRGDVALGLRLWDLTLFVERDGAVSVAFSLGGMRNEDAGAWLAEELARCGLEAGGAALPYGDDLPARVTGLQGTYDVAGIEPHLSELSDWFANASGALEAVRAETADLRPGPSEVRCWPHHFDIATLISLSDGDAEEARSIGVGLSPGDATYDQPYFYVSPWPYPEADALPPLPGIGAWNTDGFVAAVATGSEIAAVADQGAAAPQFLQVAVNACRKALSD
ncbi:MAG: hypothetical protein ACR2PM_11320, partial [Hyphomicrobiales bacterium]